jgi:serine/threonine protein kinase
VSEAWWAGPDDEPDRYALWAAIGGGAEGTVYRATCRLADGDIDVAVKMMSPDRFDGRGEPAEQLAARWSTHAARLRNLSHPGLVAVQEAFLGAPPHQRGAPRDGRAAYFVMAWVDGRDYGTWAFEQPSLADRLGVLEQVAGGLDELHRAQQVHADVKPNNILVKTTTIPTGATVDSTVLVDFGVMRTITHTPATQVTFAAGYAAPEVTGQGVYTPASDLYALAGVVYFALAGQHPPTGPSAVAQVRQSLDAQHIPGATVEAIVAALDPDPTRRPRVGCRTWLTHARGGLSSGVMGATMLLPGGASGGQSGGPSGDPSTNGPSGANGDKSGKATVSRATKVVLSVAVTVTIGGAGAVLYPSIADPGPTTTTTVTTASTTTAEPATTTTRPSTTTTSPSPNRPPQAGDVFLSDVDRVASTNGWSAYPNVRIDGVEYVNGLRSSAIDDCSQSVRDAEYSIDRRYQTLSAVVGLSDDSASNGPVLVEMVGDGAVIWSGVVQVGIAEEVAIDVSGVLRVRLVATRQFDDLDGTSTCRYVHAAIGNPRLD